jgi:UDP-N-acetylmuramyl tripeptide synthase
MAFMLDEVRRLTGPNLLSDEPGAIADALFSETDPQSVLNCWQKHLLACQKALAWAHGNKTYHRFYEGGLSVSIPAPMDLLYSACDLLELAWDLCAEELSTQPHESINIDERLEALRLSIKEERNPALMQLIEQAKQHNVVCLADDDELSLGTGPSAETWTINNIPSADKVNWPVYKAVPLALITGTNGKSTSVRLAAEIAKAAGMCAGVTSTDFIKVGDTIIDKGDYSGPGGARMLLRDNRTEIAFLEVARGGLLRRGLPVNHANAALITNVASDHLGQYGINTVDDIAQVKTMVAKAIGPLAAQYGAQENEKRVLVLNADDTRLAAIGKHFDMPLCWFSQNPNHPLIINAIEHQQPCVYAQNGELVYSHITSTNIARIDAVPMTIKGTAAHNIQNALGVIGLCKALGIDDEAIQAGLYNFTSSAKDNPGRGNIYGLNGVTFIIDFAHNGHSMQAVMDMAAKMPANNIHVMFSHAGDRSDQDIRDVTNAVLKLAPSTYALAEIEQYLRGRELGEISKLVREHLLDNKIASTDILLAANPIDGAKQLLKKAKAGDLVLLFVLSDREKVQALLKA